MFSHQPPGYRYPFCEVLRGVHNDNNAPSDLLVQGDLVLARLAPKRRPANPGGVLVIPVEHHENLYDLPRDVGHAVSDLTQDVAVATKRAYGCDGTSTRQHNEPAPR